MDDVLLKNLERLVPHEYGTIWLKKTFLLPESLKGEDVACYLGRITLADRTYLNGFLIGHKGKGSAEDKLSYVLNAFKN